MNKKKTKDERRQFLVRYVFDESGKVSFMDPCCDTIPVDLFCEIMKALCEVQKKWNDKIMEEKQ